MNPIKSLSLVLVASVMLMLGACAPAPTNDGMEGMDHGEDGTMDSAEMMQAGVDALTGLSGDEFEVAFVDAMIPHHQSAVDMATIALERAQQPETRAAAEAIIAAQDAEIAQMTTWLSEWHGRTPSGDDHGMSMSAETDALRTVPVETFDVAFLEAMIPHHESAIAMAQLVPERTERPELRALADAIISTQQAEIAEFNAWLAAWKGNAQ